MKESKSIILFSSLASEKTADNWGLAWRKRTCTRVELFLENAAIFPVKWRKRR